VTSLLDQRLEAPGAPACCWDFPLTSMLASVAFMGGHMFQRSTTTTFLRHRYVQGYGPTAGLRYRSPVPRHRKFPSYSNKDRKNAPASIYRRTDRNHVEELPRVGSRRRGYFRKILFSRWTLLGVFWTGCWVAYGRHNTETVPLTGRSRYAGGAAHSSSIPQHAMAMIDEVELQALSLPLDDPRYQRVKGILDRLMTSARLESSRWRFLTTKRAV
jgi:hypothetical protein